MERTEEILHLSFNEDYGCFSCGTESGFKIFNTYPFKESYSCELGGGIGIVEMLYRCNILALVGGGKTPKFQATKLMLWDDYRVKCVGEMSFRSEVKAVRLKQDRIVVVLETKIYIYNLADLKFIEYIDTSPNPLGLCSMNTVGDSTIIAAPDKDIGFVIVNFLSDKKRKVIQAHQSALYCLQLNFSGTRVATASQKGTIIRIFDTESGEPLQELRRGSEYAYIYSVAFDPNDRFLAITSDSGTIHVFCLKKTEKEIEALEEEQQEQLEEQEEQQSQVSVSQPESEPPASEQETLQEQGKNPKSMLRFMKFIVPYFDSEWSFAQFKVMDSKTKVAFGPEDNTLIIISYEGNYYQCSFDPINGGECNLQHHFRILQFENK